MEVVMLRDYRYDLRDYTDCRISQIKGFRDYKDCTDRRVFVITQIAGFHRLKGNVILQI